MQQPPVYIWGMGQGHPGDPRSAGSSPETETGAKIAAETVFSMAGVGPSEIDICELYDCYTYTVIVTLEDYGFCKKAKEVRLSKMENWGLVVNCRRTQVEVNYLLFICGG